MPIRRWLYLALIAAFLLPVIVGVVSQLWLSDQRVESRLSQELRRNVERWEDPSWHESVEARFRGESAEYALFHNGAEIYRSAVDLPETEGNLRWMVGQEVIVDGGNEYVAYVYFEEPEYPVGFLLALATLALTVIGLAWFLARMVVRPLGATSQAARNVSAGDLDVELPSSRVREVADVNEAFVRMSTDLRESLEERSRLEQDRRLFIGAIAHDLRTPLFSLRGHLEGLDTGLADDPEKRQQYVTVAREKAGALERLVADLFDFARLEYLDQAPNREPLDLVDVLERLIAGIQPQAETKSVDLSFETPSGPCMVNGDAHLLTRAIENILDNAIRHTPVGGTVRVSCNADDEQIRFVVSDSGPGIPPDDLTHVFTPLYRGDASRSRRTGGTGLGLAIARRIIRAHDGDLSVANGPEGGAVFSGSMPAHFG